VIFKIYLNRNQYDLHTREARSSRVVKATIDSQELTSISSFSVAALISFSVFIIDKCQCLWRLSFNLFALAFTHSSDVVHTSSLHLYSFPIFSM